MTDEHTPWYEDLVLPVLLGAARGAYGSSIRAALQADGFDDMPRSGPRAVGGIARNGSLRDVSRELGISKQAASQLVDTLVVRGYCVRLPDDTDRRRLIVELTERGRAAAAVVNRAVTGLDAALEGRVGADSVRTARRVLGELVSIDHAARHPGT